MKNAFMLLIPSLLVSLTWDRPGFGQSRSAWQEKWEKVVEAARKEGQVVVAGGRGVVYDTFVKQFEQAYPEIRVKYTGLSGPELAPKLLMERRAGKYLWDVQLGSTVVAITSLKPAGAYEPVMPVLILPEVLDDSRWLGGLNTAFMDAEGKFVFSFQAHLTHQVLINREAVPEKELGATEQLTDPKWSGKISVSDPRVQGPGNGRLAFWMVAIGEGFVRKLLQQKLAVTRTGGHQLDWLLTGKYPISIGGEETDLAELQKRGAGKNILPLVPGSTTGSRLSSAFGNVMRMNRPPHPNAAIVFINWLLSRQGQTAWVRILGRNSRRLDVPNDPETAPKPSVKYYTIDSEERLHLRQRVAQIANEYIK
jgi:iron(III) transport system substrate-binding protein